MRLSHFLIYPVVMLGFACLAYAASEGFPGRGSPVGAENARQAEPSREGGPAIRIRGRVWGLYPGARKRFKVRVRNRTDRPQVVRAIRIKARRPGPGCRGKNVRVRNREGLEMRLGPHATRSVWLTARMIPDAADACQGERFRLIYRTRAKARR